MIGPRDKGFQQQSSDPPSDETSSSLRYLPKYIAYRAALLREKLILTYVIAIISVIFGVYFVCSRIEIAALYEQLRTKEYILAPGVQDFTAATPQAVPDSYVNDAATDFLSSLGNVNAHNIEEQYEALKRFMSPELKVQFAADSGEWVEQVKSEDLAQIFRIKSKNIASNDQGSYAVTAFVRADFYAAGQSLGHEDQVVEMVLTLVPPESGKRWYLQITALTWSKLESFQTKKVLTNTPENPEEPK